MSAQAYYNEIDPFAAEWLLNLISAGHIAPGEVDSRSIVDVRPRDLAGFTQCHFFAGVGVWSYALRLAAWPDERPVWTGSCPCQPFSVAGAGAGFDDARHLWPFWHKLIEECRPPVVFGEQVDAAIKHGWLDLVQDEMERSGYAFGAVGVPAAGFGAPHIRQRLYWVADSDEQLGDQRGSDLRGRTVGSDAFEGAGPCCGSLSDGMADSGSEGLAQRERFAGVSRQEGGDDAGQAPVGNGICSVGGLGDTYGGGRSKGEPPSPPAGYRGPSHTAGFWDPAEWLLCRDGKRRPVEPGTFPLAHGAPSRVGRLRAYGNAIVPQVAKEVILAYLGATA